MNARGFALPMVIVLALVAGIVSAVVLERQGAMRQIVARQLYGYQDQHFERGVREVVGQWTDSLIRQPIEKLIGDDGHALDIQRPDGSLVSVYLFDGQGTALSDPSGLPEQEAADVIGIMQELKKRLGGRVSTELVRPVGGVRICMASASPDVLEAVGMYITGGRGGHRFAESLIEARRRGDITEADFNTAMSAGGMSAEQQNTARRLLTLKPDLWNMVVDVLRAENAGDVLIARYGGRFQMSQYASGATGRATSMVSLGKFLSWEPLPIEEDKAN